MIFNRATKKRGESTMFYGMEIGMDYGKAMDLFGNVTKKHNDHGGISWFKAVPKEKEWGIYPILQVTGRDGKIIEILASADWDFYGKSCPHDKNKAESIMRKCVFHAESEYGTPTKSEYGKRIWDMEDGTRIKIKLVKSIGYDVNIRIFRQDMPATMPESV